MHFDIFQLSISMLDMIKACGICYAANYWCTRGGRTISYCIGVRGVKYMHEVLLIIRWQKRTNGAILTRSMSARRASIMWALKGAKNVAARRRLQVLWAGPESTNKKRESAVSTIRIT